MPAPISSFGKEAGSNEGSHWNGGSENEESSWMHEIFRGYTYIVFFASISFISALIFMLSFLQLTLGFVCSSFSSSFRCKVRLFICDISCFLR